MIVSYMAAILSRGRWVNLHYLSCCLDRFFSHKKDISIDLFWRHTRVHGFHEVKWIDANVESMTHKYTRSSFTGNNVVKPVMRWECWYKTTPQKVQYVLIHPNMNNIIGLCLCLCLCISVCLSVSVSVSLCLSLFLSPSPPPLSLSVYLSISFRCLSLSLSPLSPISLSSPLSI